MELVGHARLTVRRVAVHVGGLAIGSHSLRSHEVLDELMHNITCLIIF